MKVGDLLINLGFDVDKNKFDDFVGSVGKLNLVSIAAMLGFGGLAAAMEKFTSNSIEASESIKELSAWTGMPEEEIDRFTRAMGRVGVKANEAQGILKTIFEMRRKAMLPGGEAEAGAFAMLGVDYRKDEISIIEKIQEELKSAKSAEAKATLASYFGMAPSGIVGLQRLDTAGKAMAETPALNPGVTNTDTKAGLNISKATTDLGTFFHNWWSFNVNSLIADPKKWKDSQLSSYGMMFSEAGDFWKNKFSNFNPDPNLHLEQRRIRGGGMYDVKVNINVETKDSRDIEKHVKKALLEAISDADRQTPPEY
ncbi:MAG: hypothetical protein WC364_14640 [Eubacteriales bacterium]|jgi:hypothetical protein